MILLEREEKKHENRERSNGATGCLSLWMNIFALHSYYIRLDIDCCAIHMCWTCIWGSARWTECRNRTHCHYSSRIEHRTRWIVSIQVRIERKSLQKTSFFVLVERKIGTICMIAFIFWIEKCAKKKNNENSTPPMMTKRQLWNGKWYTSWWNGHIEESIEPGN